MSDQTKQPVCKRCDGCGQIANDDEGTPWSVWEDLPPESQVAMRMGLVKPLACPDCGGSGHLPLSDMIQTMFELLEWIKAETGATEVEVALRKWGQLHFCVDFWLDGNTHHLQTSEHFVPDRHTEGTVVELLRMVDQIKAERSTPLEEEGNDED